MWKRRFAKSKLNSKVSKTCVKEENSERKKVKKTTSNENAPKKKQRNLDKNELKDKQHTKNKSNFLLNENQSDKDTADFKNQDSKKFIRKQDVTESKRSTKYTYRHPSNASSHVSTGNIMLQLPDGNDYFIPPSTGLKNEVPNNCIQKQGVTENKRSSKYTYQNIANTSSHASSGNILPHSLDGNDQFMTPTTGPKNEDPNNYIQKQGVTENKRSSKYTYQNTDNTSSHASSGNILPHSLDGNDQFMTPTTGPKNEDPNNYIQKQGGTENKRSSKYTYQNTDNTSSYASSGNILTHFPDGNDHFMTPTTGPKNDVPNNCIQKQGVTENKRSSKYIYQNTDNTSSHASSGNILPHSLDGNDQFMTPTTGPKNYVPNNCIQKQGMTENKRSSKYTYQNTDNTSSYASSGNILTHPPDGNDHFMTPTTAPKNDVPNNCFQNQGVTENKRFNKYTYQNIANTSSHSSSGNILTHPPDGNDHFITSNSCLPTTSKRDSVSTNNDIHGHIRKRETSLQRHSQSHSDDLNPSTNDTPKRTSDTKLVDPHYSHSNHSPVNSCSSWRNSKPVPIATQSGICNQKDPRQDADFFDNVDIDRLNSFCKKERNLAWKRLGTWNEKPSDETIPNKVAESGAEETNSTPGETPRGICDTQDISVRLESNSDRPSNDSNGLHKPNVVPQTKSTSKINRQVQCNLYDYPSRSFQYQQEVYSSDRREYIKRDFTDGKLSYSSKFVKKLSQTEIIIRIHGPDNLLTLNRDNFVARIQAKHRSMLNFRETFQSIKYELLSRITITKILEDGAIDQRNYSYRLFKEMLQDRVNLSTEHVDCAEDLLQLSNIYNQKLKFMLYVESKIILKEIIKNKYISTALKQSAEQFLNNENELWHRNKYLPKFSDSALPAINDFPNVIYNIFHSGIINHKNNLKKFPHKFKRFLKILDIDYLPNIVLLSLNGKDIKLFLDIVTIANQQNESSDAIIPQEYILNIWNNFYNKIIQLPKYESIKELGSLTNPIYFFLFKSFCEIIVEISRITKIPYKDFVINTDGKFSVKKSFQWPEETPFNKTLEKQYRLIFDLMEHYEPGKYSNKKSFKYKFQLMNVENKTGWRQYLQSVLKINKAESITEDRLVWLCILDCGLAQITPSGETNENIQKLTHTLQKLFAKFLEKAEHDRHESFRIAVHNITKLAGHIYNYISTVNSKENDIDQKILDKQTDLISDILVSEDHNSVISHFANLVDVYKEYWKNRTSIVGKIFTRCPCKEFETVMKENIFLQLLEIVNKSLRKSVVTQEVIKYFRLYNEFLQHFDGIEFKWLVSAKSLPDNFSKKYVTLVDAGRKYYQVTNPEQFILELKERKVHIPEHYLITVVTELLCIISKSLDKVSWSDSNQLKAAGDLFLAIGHTLIHFKDQANYVDFDNFVRNCTFPFSDVLMNSETYTDFKTRLDNVENFYLYTNKQKEISIDNALNLCVVSAGESINKDFITSIDHKILKDSYLKYSTKYSSLEKYITVSDIHSIIADMRKDLENILPIDEWTPEFKMDVLPLFLANLAAVWTIMESKDLARIGKRIEPHVIQILCILRLLGVDKKSDGIDKHLAQVLTGQGKSIVLGLLSSLLAVVGNECIVACYSEYLAKRDMDAFEKFFDVFSEFGVKRKISYRTIDDAVSDFLSQNINGKEISLRTLVTALVLDALPVAFTASDRTSTSNVLLIDEVDVFFSDEFYGSFYRAGVTVPSTALLEIQPKIWEIVEDGMYDKDIVCERIMEFINGILKDGKQEVFKDFLESANELFKTHLDKMIKCAIDVSKSKINKNSFSFKYRIDTEGKITYRESDGIYTLDTVSQYYNVFNYFYLKETDFQHKNYHNYGYLIIHCGSISYANLPREFPVILGVSGTLTTLHDFEKSAINSYGINAMSVMPSFFGDRKLKFAPTSDCILKSAESGWLDCIYDKVNERVQNGRAVIVFFETEHEMNLFDEKYRSRINRLHKMTGNEEPSTLEWYISESGVAQTVTLATRLMGRGVDFKSNDLSVEQKGGVHVIQSFFSLDVKEEVQIQGRTARKDNEGSYELILCHQHLDQINCLKKTDGNPVTGYKDLCEIRKKLADCKGAAVQEKIKSTAKKHDLTMKFLKSFADYTPSKRPEYFSSYPFVELED